MRGFANRQRFDEENTGLPFTPFKIKEKGPAEIVRVLLPVDDIQSLIVHRRFKVLNQIRCAAAESLQANPDVCPLCAVKAPRTMRTYIPVLRRQRKDETNYEPRVEFIEYGREGVGEVASLLEDVNNDITSVDFKIKRIGVDKETKYKWLPVNGTQRDLNEEERALEIPDIDELLPIKPEVELLRRAEEWRKYAEGVKAVDGKAPSAADDEGEEEGVEDEIPF